MTTYSAQDTPESLSKEQLDLIATSDHQWLISYLEEKTNFDCHRIRLMLELGSIEAKKRLADFKH